MSLMLVDTQQYRNLINLKTFGLKGFLVLSVLEFIRIVLIGAALISNWILLD